MKKAKQIQRAADFKAEGLRLQRYEEALLYLAAPENSAYAAKVAHLVLEGDTALVAIAKALKATNQNAHSI